MAHGNQVKVIGWYDNEWGYSCRLVDLIDRAALSAHAALGSRRRRRRQARARARRPERAARGRARSPTTRGSARRCRRSSCCSSAARREVVVCSHLGRPEGTRTRAFSMKPVEARLRELLPGRADPRAREHALRPGRDEERPGVRARARRRARPLRQRRVRLGAPRARVDRRRRRAAARLRRPAARARAGGARQAARRRRAAVRPHLRRREGGGQARRAREPRRQGRRRC